MSFSISEPAEATTAAPTRNTGTMRTSPTRIPHASAMPPTIGRRSSPGRIHSAATAKPNERILGGIASERAAKIGGTISTTRPVTSAFMITATTRFGLSANAVHAAPTASETPATKRGTSVALRTNRRVMMRVVSNSPMSWAGATNAKT